MRTAVLQMADSQEIESTTIMLRSAGYRTMICGDALRSALVLAGCDTVIAHASMRGNGYPELMWDIPEAGLDDMETCDLFCEIKCRNIVPLWKAWPRLRGKTLWKRVNGARPEICPKGGDEVNLLCPIVTADLWYGLPEYNGNGLGYVMWPPFSRLHEYDPGLRAGLESFEPPISLCHGIEGWGYKQILERARAMGILTYGIGNRLGLIANTDVPTRMSRALCLVHLKAVDCPGWVLYEALAAAMPIVLPRRCIERMRAHELFEVGVSCLAYDDWGNEWGRGEVDGDTCVEEIAQALEVLKDPQVNRQIGLEGRERLLRLMWNEERDGDGFRAFMARHFP